MNPLMDEQRLDKARIDHDYNARATVTPQQFDAEMARYRSVSERMAAQWGRHLDVVYDGESGQRLDIFGPQPDQAGTLAPVMIFIHGGYWRALSKQDSAMMAGTLAGRGIATVAVDYALAPAVSLAEIVRQVRAAVAFIWHHGRDYGLDRDRIMVSGSSAGGHLAAAVLAHGWQEAAGLPQDLIKFAMPVSGLFELSPLSRSFAQEWLNLDKDAIAQLSPIRHVPPSGCPIILAWAGLESPGFKRQSLAYAEAWREKGGNVSTLEVEGRNHFDILMDWTDPGSALSQALFAGIEAALPSLSPRE